MDEVSVENFDEEYKRKVQEMEACNRRESKRVSDFANDLEDLLYQYGAKEMQNMNQTMTVDGMEIDEVISTVDPISKGQIHNPVRNKHCNHIYDKDTITQAIHCSESKRVRCPQVGCSNKKSVEVSDLVEDRELKRKFMILLQRQEMTQEED